MKHRNTNSLIVVIVLLFASGIKLNAQLPYCTAAGKVQYYEYIDYISIGTIARTSVAEVGGYHNETVLSTDLVKGADYTLTFSHANPAGGYTEHFNVFIDWNIDGDFFDAGESVLATITYSTINYTAIITVPLTATTGLARMRVCMESALFPAPLACGKFFYGEVEDYTLNILGDITCSESLEPNNTKGTAKPIGVNTEIQSQISSATDIDWLSFNNSLSTPNIQVLLTGVPANYNIKLYGPGGALIGTSATGGLSNETITYNTAIVGTYKIKVYGVGGVFSNVDCYTIASNLSATPFRTINEGIITELPEIDVYPIPAGNEFTILYSGKEGNALIKIYSGVGQMVFAKTVALSASNTKLTVNSTSWENGIYYLEFIQDNKIVQKQIIITK